jgi:hypothetical protein
MRACYKEGGYLSVDALQGVCDLDLEDVYRLLLCEEGIELPAGGPSWHLACL